MGKIGSGNHVLLVYDYNLYPKFLNYLNKKGYHTASPHGYYESCPWIYVNIELKTYFPGMPGVKITECFNNHAITIDEFHTILAEYKADKENYPNTSKIKEIYDKYKGKSVFVFHNEPFDYDLEKFPVFKKEWEKSEKAAKEECQECKKKQKEKEENTLCLFDIPSTIKARPEVRYLYELNRNSIKCKGLPESGNYKGEIKVCTIMGPVNTECEVCFFDDKILILAENPDEDEDFFDTLRIFMDRIPDDKRNIVV